MPVYNGTDAGEVIVGTSGNDTFNTSKGQDILSGDGGIDTLNADFSTAAGTQNNIGADEFGLTGTLRERDTGWITEFLGMEHVNVKGTPQDDGFYLSFDIPLGTKTIKLDAGAGFDWITLYVEFSDTALVGSVSGGTLASGNFTLTGFEQFDMRLGRGNDDLTFAAGNETIRAGEGNDRIFGGAGNDTLEGGLGGDRLDGGDGNDQLFAFDDYSGVDSGSEIDNLTGGGGNDLISIGYGDSGDGGAGSDRLSYSLLGGSAGAVLDLSAMFAGGTITVGGGTLKGFESYDVIYGSNFADTIITGDAPNVGTFLATGIQGFDGDDKITTGSSTDSVGGGAGNDTIHGGGDDDRLEGGDGNDTVYGDSGNDLVWGAGGSDELHGGDGDDRLEADDFYSANGDDKLFGEAGNDVLVGGFGANTYNGGSGDDSFLLFRPGTVVEAIGGGIDTLYADVDAFNTELDFVLTPGAEVEFLEPGQNAGFTAVNFTGNEFAQQLRGTSAANRLDGGGGADTMIGMNGNDTYFVDNAGDKAIEGAGGGVDKVFASVSYTLAAGQQLEFLATTNESGTAGINLTGNEVANTVTGNAGANRLDGGGGADTLKGLGGNDTYVVDASLDKVIETAGQGNDTVMATVSYALAAGTEVETLRAADAAATDAIDLSGNEFANNLIGNAGANVLNGGTGADTMKGGAGDDAYVVDIAGDVVVEADGGGTDEIRTTLSEFSLASTANVENLTGLGAAANKLTGNAGANRLDGRGGADTMIGGAGDDTYVVDNAADATVEAGGGGTDTVLASVAHTLAAEVENLVLTGAAAKGTGNALANVITGNAGANALDGGAGEDTLAGGEGADRLVGGAGADRLDGGPGADVIVYLAVGESTGEALDTVVGFETGVDRIDLSAALAGSVRLTAADGATIATIDTVNGAMTIRVEGAVAESDFILTRGLIFGTPEADELVGTAGADVIFGAAGADSMTGGAGNDRYIVDDPGDLVTEAPGEGTDTVESAISYALRPDVERLVLTGSGAIDGSGNTLDNLITGNGAANRLSGGEGNDKIGGGSGTDTLDGGAGNDTLDGGTGADAMRGGDGNDIYVVDNTLDKAVEASAAGGVDTVLSAVSYTLGANIEKLVLTGAAVANATGNALANALTGNGAANVLNGGAGADSMAGGAGDDIYVVDNALDTAIESSAAGGSDTVRSSVSYTLGANVENLVLTGTGAIAGTGNALANSLTGNAGANLLNGGAGADNMAGGNGNDVYIVDNALDKVLEESTTGGTDEVRSAVAYTLGSNLEKLTLTGSAAVAGTGNSLANLITGNGAANRLDGGAGADTMRGGGGNDTYIVDNVGDKAIEASAADGVDTVQSTVSFALGANVEKLVLTGTATVNATGNGLANSLAGNSAANVLNGGAGADVMTGGAGDDTYVVDNAADKAVEALGGGNDSVISSVEFTLGANVENLTLTGNAAIAGTGNGLANVVNGNTADNVLRGGAGDDVLRGGGGADALVGGEGSDSLKGGDGADRFLFNAPLGPSNVDRVIDFVRGTDKLALDNAVFGTLPAGALAPAAFVVGTAAGDASDRIIYDPATGALWYDRDGTGAAAAVQFAVLDTKPATLAATDFIVI